MKNRRKLVIRVVVILSVAVLVLAMLSPFVLYFLPSEQVQAPTSINEVQTPAPSFNIQLGGENQQNDAPIQQDIPEVDSSTQEIPSAEQEANLTESVVSQ